MLRKLRQEDPKFDFTKIQKKEKTYQLFVLALRKWENHFIRRVRGTEKLEAWHCPADGAGPDCTGPWAAIALCEPGI